MYPMLRDADEELIGFGEKEIMQSDYDDVQGRFAKLY
jgi:hypothetical protein